MRPDEKEFLGNVLKMSAVAWFIHTFVETPLHEYGHYWAASRLGAPMYIDGEHTVWVSSQVVPHGTEMLIFLSGGLCAGFLLLVLFALLKAPFRDGLLPLIAGELAYAPLDTTMAGDALGLVVLAIVWGLVFGVYLARFMGWRLPTPRVRSSLRIALRLPHGSRPLPATPRQVTDASGAPACSPPGASPYGFATSLRSPAESLPDFGRPQFGELLNA